MCKSETLRSKNSLGVARDKHPYRFYTIICSKMSLLSKKQQEERVSWYKSIYWDTSAETGTWEIPKLHESLQREHIKMWKDFLIKLLWPRISKRIYTHRGWRKEDYLHVVFWGLYLNYWPTWVDDEWNPSKEHLWLDDVD